eukprot:gene2562-biopygen11237
MELKVQMHGGALAWLRRIPCGFFPLHPHASVADKLEVNRNSNQALDGAGRHDIIRPRARRRLQVHSHLRSGGAIACASSVRRRDARRPCAGGCRARGGARPRVGVHRNVARDRRQRLRVGREYVVSVARWARGRGRGPGWGLQPELGSIVLLSGRRSGCARRGARWGVRGEHSGALARACRDPTLPRRTRHGALPGGGWPRLVVGSRRPWMLGRVCKTCEDSLHCIGTLHVQRANSTRRACAVLVPVVSDENLERRVLRSESAGRRGCRINCTRLALIHDAMGWGAGSGRVGSRGVNEVPVLIAPPPQPMEFAGIARPDAAGALRRPRRPGTGHCALLDFVVGS